MNSNRNDKRNRSLFRRGTAGFVILTLMFSLMSVPVYASSNATNQTPYEKVLSAQDAVKDAKKALEDAEERYKTGDVSDEDLEYVGWEFLDMMVETAYENDKDDIDSSDLVPLSKLTVQGNIDKALKVSSCRSAINKFNNSKSASKTFEGRLKRALSVKNIKKALDIIDKCNSYRKRRGLSAYKVSPYLMAGAAVSGLITFKNGSHSYPHSGKFTNINGVKVSESYAWGYSDPFYIWYTVESRRAAAGQGGTSHFRAIINKRYKLTGASWYDPKNLANQVFTKSSAGTSYTTSEFRKLFDDYVKTRKQEVADEKKALLQGDKEPNYLIEARENLEKAQKKYAKALKAYKPTLVAVNYNYRTIKVKFSIPEEFSGIEIYRSETGKKNSFELIKSAKKGTYIYDSNKPVGTTLYYKMRLYKKVNGEKVFTKYSDTVSATTLPSKTRNVEFKVTESSKTIKISWFALHGVTGYNIYAKGDDDKYYKQLKPGEEINGLTLKEAKDPTKASASITYKKAGTYRFKIRAYAVNEETGDTVFGNYSEIAKVTI